MSASVTVITRAILGIVNKFGQRTTVKRAAMLDHQAQVNEFGHLAVNACIAGGGIWGRLLLGGRQEP